MNGQLAQREKKIEDYTTGTTQQNLQSLQDEENKTLGNVPSYQSGQNIINRHEASMQRYAEHFAMEPYRDLFDRGDEEDEAAAQWAMGLQREEDIHAGRTKAVIRQEQFYFRRSERSFAKAERYRRLSQNNGALEAHASAHSNRSASKRAKKARETSKAYKKVARLQTAYERDLEKRELLVHERSQDDVSVASGRRLEYARGTWKAKSLADYARLEEITRARIEALTLAAQVKSISKQQENYSIQRGTLKNLLILRDSLNRLIEKNEGKPEEAELKTKLAALQDEIADTQNKVDRFLPRS